MTQRSRGQRTLGFVPLARTTFTERALRDPERFRAYSWLNAEAAWKPEGRRGPWGVVHLERGELAFTVRWLAEQWNWPKSNVQRFLDRLKRDGLATMCCRKTGTTTGTATGTGYSHEVQIITISNYNQFVVDATGEKKRADQEAGQEPGQQSAESPTIPGLLEPLTIKQGNKSIKLEADQKVKRPSARELEMPKDGALTRKGNVPLRFAAYGSGTWFLYADDYREKIGAEPLPVTYANGKGRWFKHFGESGKPDRLYSAERIEQADERAKQFAAAG